MPDRDDDYPNDSSRSSKTTNDGSAEISEDEWYRWEFDWNEATHLEYEMLVRSGPELEAILMDESEYSHFREGNRAKFYSGLSDTGVELRASGWVEAGEYVLVVDNSEYGEVEPPTNFDDDVAEIEYELILSR